MDNLTGGLLFNDTMVMIAGPTATIGSNSSSDAEFRDPLTYEYDSSPCSSSASSNSPVYFASGSQTQDLFNEFNGFELGGNTLLGSSGSPEETSYMEELIASDLSSDEDKFLESIRFGGGLFAQHNDLLSEEELVNTIQNYGEVKVVQVESPTQDVRHRVIDVVENNERVAGTKKRKANVAVSKPIKRVVMDRDDDLKEDMMIEGEDICGSPGSPQEQHTSFQELKLSDEEKRLLSKEGITLPSHYPLTKLEERELKRIRRKIRNKISAQDSRKRKKEFLDRLQQRVQEVEDEKSCLQKRVRSLESINSKLNAQVKRLQQALQSATSGTAPSSAKQTVVPAATTLLVLILSLALVVLPTVEKKSHEQSTNEIISLLNRSNELGNNKNMRMGTINNMNKGNVPRSRAMLAEHEIDFDDDGNNVVELMGEVQNVLMRMRGRKRLREAKDKRIIKHGRFGGAQWGGRTSDSWWESDDEQPNNLQSHAFRNIDELDVE
ncbi:unnamed protein product [Orchesella dallaii]|uniref:BZIP domain-containing protein n=1 Tax=Orchesella dallaii TaxID=48710 RepID=A0ABP1PKJ1_9HEXA